MKKYIFFQSTLLLFLCISLHVNSMEPEVSQDKVCYLAMIPVDLWNCITQFLPWEEQEQFLARIKIEKDEKFPKEHYAYFSDDIHLKKGPVYGVFSPDKYKVALCDWFFHTCNQSRCVSCKTSRLIIVDLQQPEGEKVIHVGHFDNGCHRAIGLASTGTMFAVIKEEEHKEEACLGSHWVRHHVLVIHKITEKSEIYKMSEDSMDSRLMKVVENYTCKVHDDFTVARLMFNKQGTYIAAYGQDYRCDPIQENYLLFDLKNLNKEGIIEEKKEVEKKDKNLLLDYFRHYRVCKEIKGAEK